ncbi:MAG: MlaE family ABC transporter permease [Pseudobdellovibrionaceae bacterium]
MNTAPLILFFIEFFHFVGGVGILTKNILKDLSTRPFYFRLVVDQMYLIGIKSWPIVIVTAISSGMVMALQFGMGLEKFGGKLYVPKVVSLSIIREIGPVFTSLMLAARVGSGIASEIGSMVVTQQIDAIRALGTSPIKKIVIPRVLAAIITVPLLAGIANLVGVGGGLIVGVAELKLDANFYYLKILETISLADLFSGLGKTVFFSLFISIPACYFGLTTEKGTRGVGIATTKAVVTASIMILVGDFILTKFFWIIEKWAQS